MDRGLHGLIVAALIVRAAAMFVQAPQLESDPDHYRQLAINWQPPWGMVHLDAEGRPQPTAFRPPAYPWLLSWFVSDGQLSVQVIAAVHLLAAAITLWGTAWLALRLAVDPRCAIALVGLDPILIAQQSQVMTETLAAAATVVIWWAWCCLLDAIERSSLRSVVFRSAVLGLILVAAHLLRPTFAPMAGLLLVAGCGTVLALVRTDRSVRAGRWWVSVCVMAAVLFVGVGLWMHRNRRWSGAPIWATTHGGYTLLLANNPVMFEDLRQQWHPGWTWEPQRFHDAWARRSSGDPRRAEFWSSPDQARATSQYEVAWTELGDDRLARDAAVAAIRRDPVAAIAAAGLREFWLWGLWPQQAPGLVKAAVGLWYAMVYGLIVWAFRRRGWRELFGQAWWVGWAVVAALVAIHFFYWSNLRMRAPAIPVLSLLAAAAALPRSARLPPEKGQASSVRI